MSPQPPAPRPRGTRNVAETVTAIVAALTGIVALVVVPGAAAILLRLNEASLPAHTGVVAGLPTETLFAIGFGWVLVPMAVLFAAIACVVVLPAKRTDESHPGAGQLNLEPLEPELTWIERSSVWPAKGEDDEEDEDRRKSSKPLIVLSTRRGIRGFAPILCSAIPLAIFALLATLAFGDGLSHFWTPVLVVVVLSWVFLDLESIVASGIWFAFHRLRGGEKSRVRFEDKYRARVPSAALAVSWHQRIANFFLLGMIFALLGGLPWVVELEQYGWAFFASAASVALWLALARPIARDRAERRSGTGSALALLAAVVIVAFLPWAVLFAGFRGTLAQATICIKDGGRVDGRLIGETSNRVYVGEAATRVVSVVDDPALARLVQEAFRSANEPIDFKPRESLATAAYSRVDMVVYDDGQTPADGLSDQEIHRINLNAVAVLRLDPDTDRDLTPVQVRQRAEAELPSVEAAEEAHESQGALPERVREQPRQRIIAIPSLEVSRLYVGGSGACPDASGALPGAGTATDTGSGTPPITPGRDQGTR